MPGIALLGLDSKAKSSRSLRPNCHSPYSSISTAKMTTMADKDMSLDPLTPSLRRMPEFAVGNSLRKSVSVPNLSGIEPAGGMEVYVSLSYFGLQQDTVIPMCEEIRAPQGSEVNKTKIHVATCNHIYRQRNVHTTKHGLLGVTISLLGDRISRHTAVADLFLALITSLI